MPSTSQAYAPYPHTAMLGFVGATAPRVPTTAGWKTPARELSSEFVQDQHRVPSAKEVGILQALAKRSNDILKRPNIVAGHPSREDEMDWNTAQGLINFYLVHGRGPDNGNPVAPPRGGPEIEALVKSAVHAVPDKKSWLESTISTITAPVTAVKHAVSTAAHAVEQVPVIGDAVHIIDEVNATPFRFVSSIASGTRLDHAVVGELKNQLKIAKEAAPYAQTVVALVPGIGTGVSAAIGAGAALAEGQSITAAAKAAIRSAIPGGALGAAAYDAALKVASGESLSQVALESARAALPSEETKKAFDIGLAVATGEKLQTALAKGLASIAPGQLQTILAAGQEALAKTPGLTDAIKRLPVGAAQEGFTLASGLLSHAGMNQAALDAVRAQLPAEVRMGFDVALKTQTPHTPWLEKVTAAAPKTSAPKIPELPKKAPTTRAPVIQDVKKPAASAPTATRAPVIQDVKKPAAPAPTATRAPVIQDVKKRAYPPYPRSSGTTHGVGAIWDSSKWRWFTVHADGKPIAQRGPVWLSDYDARREGESLLEATQGRDYIGSVTRWDWDGQAWHQTPGSALGAPPHHGGGHHGGGHPHGGHAGGHPRIFRGGRGVPGWWGEYYPLPAEVVTTTQTCRTWGDVVPIPPPMVQAVKTAIGSSGGRPTTMRSNDGTLYLFTVEDGGIAARPCVSFGVV
jgi:hypothetical protein